MPAPGDQHKQVAAPTPVPTTTSVTQNPFEEQKPQISAYTAQEIATLQSRLNKRLGPEYISTRAGPGNSRVAYLPAEKAINLANEVFGFNGWSSSIQNIQIDFVDENPTKGTISIGLSVVVRVTLRDGTYHEDTGYGGIENCKSKIAAFEKAKKEGTTDALKRALRNFGNVLGNCIYDKDYITKVSKIKAGTGRWDVNDLYRHDDFVAKKEEPIKPPPVESLPLHQPPSLIPDDSFDVNDFDDADFNDLGNPDEVLLAPIANGQQKGQHHTSNSRPPPMHEMTPSKPPQNRPNQQPQSHPQQQRPQQQHQMYQSHQQRQQQQPVPKAGGQQQYPVPPGETHSKPVQRSQEAGANSLSRSSSPGHTSQHFNNSQAPLGPPTVAFFSARAADKLDENNNPTGAAAAVKYFDMHSESPSIKKTDGVDHTKSLALNKKTLKPEPLQPLLPKDNQEQSETAISKPQLEQRRSLGPGQVPAGFSPAGMRTPGHLTSAYRPPTRHGPANGSAAGTTPTSGERAGMKRPPLTDLSNLQSGSALPNGGDVKRQRVGPGLSGSTENTLPTG